MTEETQVTTVTASAEGRVTAAQALLRELKRRPPTYPHQAELEAVEARANEATNGGDVDALAALVPLRQALREIHEVESTTLNQRHSAEVEAAEDDLRVALGALAASRSSIAQDARQREVLLREIATQRQTVARTDGRGGSRERLRKLEDELRELDERQAARPEPRDFSAS
jgi:hypothetical protein